MEAIVKLWHRLNELIENEPHPVNRARIRTLSHGLLILLGVCASLIVIYTIQFQPVLVSRAILYLFVFGVMLYLLLFKRAWRLVGHVFLWCLLSVIISNMVIYRNGVSLLTIQYCLLIVSGAFYVLGVRWGIIYALLSILPVVGYMLLWRTGTRFFFVTISEVSSAGFFLVLVTNFVMLVLIHYHVFKSFYNIQEQQKTNQARLLAAILTAGDAARSRNDFLSSISHELRTPLNAVIGMTNVLLMSSPRKDQEENLSILQFSAESLLALINDLLDFNKIDAGKVELEMRAFEPAHLMEDIYESFAIKASEKQLTYELEMDPALKDVHIMGDQTRLMQMMVNLISNALKFTAEGSVKIKASVVREEGSRIVLGFAVSDTGPGIPPNKQQVIFEPFMQASPTVLRQHGGTGLGLPIVKRLLELHDSHIVLESTVGMGSVFSFEISYERALTATPSTVSAAIQELPTHNLRVLVAEDNEVNAVVMKKILDKLGITHTVVGNGLEAVNAVGQQQYHIIFMDIHMPVMDGLEAIRQIRALPDPVKASVYIIVLSASDEGTIRDTDVYPLINDVLPKPFSLQHLQDKLKRYIGK